MNIQLWNEQIHSHSSFKTLYTSPRRDVTITSRWRYAVWAGEAGAQVMRHLCPTNHPNVRHISAEIRHTGPARPITAGLAWADAGWGHKLWQDSDPRSRDTRDRGHMLHWHGDWWCSDQCLHCEGGRHRPSHTHTSCTALHCWQLRGARWTFILGAQISSFVEVFSLFEKHIY